MPHFADRLPLENFVIHDVKRNIFALHEAKKDWYLVYNPVGLDRIKYTVSDKEKEEILNDLSSELDSALNNVNDLQDLDDSDLDVDDID